MAEIIKFNVTAQAGQPGYSVLQSGWRYKPYYMGRIPADYGLPIMCIAGFGNRYNGMVFVESEGRDYDALAPCCPLDRKTSGGTTNVLRLEHNTGFIICFTNDTALATQWSQCVSDAARARIAQVRASADNMTLVRLNKGNITVENVGSSRCEYIDYDILKQGIVKSACAGMKERLMGHHGVWGMALGWIAVMAVSTGL